MKKWLAVETNHQDIMLTYNFNSNKVRVVILNDDKPYFFVEDICEILKTPIERLNEEEKTTYKISDEQEVTITSEFGLYDLMLDSVGEREFKCWILKEILPEVKEVAEAESIDSRVLIYALAIQKEIVFNEDRGIGYLSIKAVTKLTGVRERAIKEAVITSESKIGQVVWNSIPRSTKTLITNWVDGREKLSDSVITKIIEYYAFDDVHERAKNTYRAFAPMGIRNWVKEAVQYVKKDSTDIDPKEVLASIDDKLSLIQQTVQELSQQFPVE
ncbi:BRO family protein [Okeania sp. SIO2B3]|uniref:BRO-N domain-containing protein n=1 Tax=Okeania sp. SIO2B3 TaxID=2607784 RepID=UPI0013C02A47|nr:BRO family protein [Okeania sp. SIO2B3]NET40854.1 hypothetical protein [Okeania sp. SIO2B3]